MSALPTADADRRNSFHRRFVLPGWQTAILLGLSLGGVAVVRYALTPWIGERPVLVFFIVPIIVGAYLGGIRAGLAATLFSAAFTFVFFMPQGGSISLAKPVDAIQWGVFLGIGTLISFLCDKLHRFRSAAELRLLEKEEAEKALGRARNYLTHVIDAMVEGVVVADQQGVLIHWNQAALDMHGMTSSGEWCLHYEDFTKIFELRELSGRVIPVSEWPVVRILAGERLNHYTIRVRRLDADWHRVFSYGGSMIRDADGQAYGYITITDITDQVEASEALQNLNTELEQRVQERTVEMEYTIKELEAFTYSVSHDLRAPLRAIDGFSELALEDYGSQLTEEGRHYLETIRNAAQRMRALIEDLLAFSRISRAPVQRLEVDTDRLVKEVVEELTQGRNDVAAEIKISPLPPCHADYAQIKQVWSNLIDNAIKYSAKSEKPIVEIGSTESEVETVYFVRDNGIGFNMDYVHKLFEVFQRLHRPDEYEGTGVGLAVVHRVITRHRGRVWAEGEEGKGAKFCFTLGEEESE